MNEGPKAAGGTAVSLGDPITLRGRAIRNRVLMPPLVCFNWSDEQGLETVSRARHYGARARGGAGLIVVEATAVTPEGRLSPRQLGLWSDAQTDQFRRIADACHEGGAAVIVQLVHAGPKAANGRGKPMEAYGEAELAAVADAFAAAAARAMEAGLDGVEVHGAHGYLLNHFSSAAANARTDGYGGSPEKRMRLPLEACRAARSAMGPGAIMSYRFGVNDPTLDDDALLAARLEETGVDLLDASAGIGAEGIAVPEGFPLPAIAWMGAALHARAGLPTACVNGIVRPEDAAWLLANGHADFAAVGRGLLADPDWAGKALRGEPVFECRRCQPGCLFREDGRRCPGSRNLWKS